MLIIPKFIYRINAMLIKLIEDSLEKWIADFKIYNLYGNARNENSQNNFGYLIVSMLFVKRLSPFGLV